MAITPDKIKQAKQMFGLSDDDIQRITAGQGPPKTVVTPSSGSSMQSGQSTSMISPQAGRLSQSSLQPSANNFMRNLTQSEALPNAGGMIGSSVGRLLGPIGGLLGAGFGTTAGDIIRKETGGLAGEVPPGEALTGALGDILKGGSGKAQPGAGVKSVKETFGKGINAAKAQVVGEAAGFALKLLKPKAVQGFLSQATDFLSKKTGMGTISPEVIKQRFMDEVVPKAFRYSEGALSEGGADVVKAGQDLLSKKTAGTNIFDTQELNHLRKNLNAVGEGATGMKKALLDGLAEIVRDEQIKLAPATGASLPLNKFAGYDLPNIIKSLPFGGVSYQIGDVLRNLAAGPLSKFAKYGGAQLLKPSNKE